MAEIQKKKLIFFKLVNNVNYRGKQCKKMKKLRKKLKVKSLIIL